MFNGDYVGEEILGRLMSYAQLQFSTDSLDPGIARFYQSTNERVTAISSHLLFLSLELNRIEEADLAGKLADPALARYAPFLRDLRVFRPHQLDDKLEKLLHEKEVTPPPQSARYSGATCGCSRW